MSMHILHTPMQEISRIPDGDARWCFVCRKKCQFEFITHTPIVSCWCRVDGPRDEHGEGIVEWSTGAYYGPTPSIRCVACGTPDGDCFPGTWREWGDEGE